MKNFTDTLATIRRNLNLIAHCFDKHPGLFEWEDYVSLETADEAPTVTVWSWTGDKPGRMRAAAAVPEGNWQRVRLANGTYSWRGQVMGVRFVWESMEIPPGLPPEVSDIDFGALNLAAPEGQDSPQPQQQAGASGFTGAGAATPEEAP
jgi:hypothetical protein